MKSIFTCIILALVTINIQAQENKALAPFSKLNISGDIKVELIKGEPKAEITMTEGDREDLIVEQKGGSLTLKFKNSILWNNDRSATIVLYNNEDFDKINVAAGSRLKSDTEFSISDCTLNVSSGASFAMIVEGDDLDMNVSSGATATLAGSASSLNINASSGGSLNGKTCKTKRVNANTSSGGSAKVWVTDHLSAQSSSGGTVKYKGDPKSTDINTGRWSGGSVRKM